MLYKNNTPGRAALLITANLRFYKSSKMPSANFLLIARKVFQRLETVQNDTKRREKPKIHWAKLTQNEAECSVRES